jgi:hypothetical protein
MKWLCVMLICFLPTSGFASIGKITKSDGPSKIYREDTTEQGDVDSDIFSMDRIETFKHKQNIDFIDDTKLEITPHSNVIIDEFVYDPANDIGSLSIKASLGTVRYASGQIGKKFKQNVKIKTPTAVIGVRGTDFTMTVDEIGSSLIILLPSCDSNGNCYVGEIEVETDAGFVIMNQAFQTTVVTTFESKPLKPIILDLDANMINNLLIVQKPRDLEEAIELAEQLSDVASALDIDFLEFNDLDEDLLEESNEELANELDIDFLLQDFLQDLLVVLNAELSKQLKQAFDPKNGFKIGFDETTGITFTNDPSYLIIKEDSAGNFMELRLDRDYSYNITLKQNFVGVDNVQLGDAGVNQITINQSN